MSVFNRGERVRIKDFAKSEKVYLIKGVKECEKGSTLYLLKSLEARPVLRLFYENEESLLERIC